MIIENQNQIIKKIYVTDFPVIVFPEIRIEYIIAIAKERYIAK
jgi:hypothetical protein